MRLLAVVLLLFAFAPASAADKDEDKAQAAAVAFLKAVKAKDVDAVMKVSAAPFASKNGDDIAILKDEAALKKWVKERLDEIKDTEVPTDLIVISPIADARVKFKNEEHRKKADEVLGKGGFIATVMSAEGKLIPILVRVKDGEAKVVGIGR